MNARKSLALLALSAVSIVLGCTGSENATGLYPASGPARLSLTGSIGSTAAATQVAIFVGYLTRSVTISKDPFQDLPSDVFGGLLTAQIFDLTATGTMTIPVTVDLGPCLADRRVQQTTLCPLVVEVILLSGHNTLGSDSLAFLDGGNVLDWDVVGAFQAAAGATVPAQFALYEINSVTVSPASVSNLQVGQTASLQATARDASGKAVAKTITFSSSNPGVATVTPAGVVTAVSVGSTQILAVAGVRSTAVAVTVVPPPTIVLPADTTARFAIAQGTSSTSTPVTFAVTSSGTSTGNQIDLAAPQIAYGPGASGWATANLTAPRTPTTLSVATTNTATIPAGTYTAVITLASSSNSAIRSRTVVATLTVSQSAVTGRVVDGATGVGLSGATITGPAGSATSAADGTFTLGGVANGATLSITAGGHVSTQYFNAQSSPGTTTQIGSIPLAPTSTSFGTVSGRIVDAVTGQGIVGASVAARSGVNATSGTASAQVTSGANGAFSISVSAGTYTVTASATNYTTGSNALAAIGGATLVNQNIVLAPVGSGNAFRFVLTWGANPVDLDSHFTGPLPNGSRFHVFFATPVARDASGAIVAQLDIDATNGFGPETVTLPGTIAGTYRYYVHHYDGTSTIGSSGATVKVFRGSSQIAQFFPPAQSRGGIDDVWSVFTLDGTTLAITSVNTIAIGVGYGGILSRLPGASVIPSAPIADDIVAIRAAVAAQVKPRSHP